MRTLALIAALGFALTPAQDVGPVDAYVRAQMDAARVPGLAIGIVDGDKVLQLRGFGAADDTGRAVTPQTPFDIGSVTKSFTAVAVMQLVENGQVRLDAPVQQYLPWFHLADGAASQAITVRELLNQTSGIGPAARLDPLACAPGSTPEDVARSLATFAPIAPPGRRYQYSNANYVVLGVLVQTVSRQPYADYVQQHILAPLDMTSTFLSGQQAARHGVAVGHRTVDGHQQAGPPGYSCPGYLPSGFIVSTAQDMTHWLIAQLNQGRYGNRSILSPTSVATLHQPGASTESGPKPATGYAMGWAVGTILGAPLIWHDGDDSYFHADVLWAPRQHLGVVVLMNATAIGSPYDRARASIAAVILASLIQANTLFGLGVPAVLALVLITQVALASRTVVGVCRGRLASAPAIVARVAWQLLVPLLVNLVWAGLLIAALRWLLGNLATGLPELLLLLPWHTSLLMASAGFAALWAVAKTALMIRAWTRRLQAPITVNPDDATSEATPRHTAT